MSFKRPKPMAFSPSRYEGVAPAPPVVFRGLSTGAKFDRTYEPQTAIPIDLSDRFVRDLSPFRLRLIPPSIFDGVIQNLMKTRRSEALYSDSGSGQSITLSGESIIPPIDDPNINYKNAPEYAKRNVEKLHGELLKIAAAVENYVGGPINMMVLPDGGYSERLNDNKEDENGVPIENKSSHKNGAAIDIRVEGVSTQDLYNIIDTLIEKGEITVGGTGYYGEEPGRDEEGNLVQLKPGKGFVHYDIRGRRSTWVDDNLKIAGIGAPPKFSDDEKSRITSTSVARTYNDDGNNGQIFQFGSGEKSNINLFEAASARYDTFSDLIYTRNTNIINILGNTSYDREVVQRYISDGRELIGNGKIDSEPGGIDRFIAVDLASQLIEMMNTPPLVLLINPSTFVVNYEKIQQYTQRTRNGYVFQSWGENQPSISFTGMIGAFVAGSLGQKVAGGVQFASKRDSASYQNLMNLLTLFRNNGSIYDNLSGVSAPYFVGSVAIEYDQMVYVGNFNSFSWSYEAEKQNGGIQFDIDFTVTQMFDNHEATENIMPLKSGGYQYGYNSPVSDFSGNRSIPDTTQETEEPEPFDTPKTPVQSEVEVEIKYKIYDQIPGEENIDLRTKGGGLLSSTEKSNGISLFLGKVAMATP